MSEYKNLMTDSMKARLLECRINNSVNLFDYKDAAAATDSLLADMPICMKKTIRMSL
ncbi:MAG: hypothetical protein IPL67_04050 [Ignavibacteria bacterium]|nr:hypothetical protein [Ignavibacteria bacterium]